MCVDPITVATVAAVAGTAVSAAGDFSQGQAVGDANDFNAQAREREAVRTTELGAIEEEKVRRRNRRSLSQQVADFGASGRDATGGTALALAFDSAQQGELDALSVRTDTILKSDKLRTEASLLRSQGDTARTQGKFSAAATILKGGGKILALS